MLWMVKGETGTTLGHKKSHCSEFHEIWHSYNWSIRYTIGNMLCLLAVEGNIGAVIWVSGVLGQSFKQQGRKKRKEGGISRVYVLRHNLAIGN